jgi:N-dimethylarginine dimethylaminohydrolase
MVQLPESAETACAARTVAWGSDSEWRPLCSVVLAWPPIALRAIPDPAAWLLRGRPDLGLLREQTLSLAAYYRAHGVVVRMLDAEDAPPNILFLRDTFLMTPAGAILARPAHAVRQPEIAYVRAFLDQERIPIIGEVGSPGRFEGADALWLRPDLLVIGVGNRTDRAGAGQVSRLLAPYGVVTRFVSAPLRSQHLLGGMVPVRDDVFLRDGVGADARALLRDGPWSLHDVADDAEVVDRRCLNLVALGPARVVAPTMSGASLARLGIGGATIDQIDVSEYLVCDGGIACATGILGRQTAS